MDPDHQLLTVEQNVEMGILQVTNLEKMVPFPPEGILTMVTPEGPSTDTNRAMQAAQSRGLSRSGGHCRGRRTGGGGSVRVPERGGRDAA